MRVIIQGEWFDSKDEMIVLVLTEEDKKFIGEMTPGQNTYACLKNSEGLTLVEDVTKKLEMEKQF